MSDESGSSEPNGGGDAPGAAGSQDAGGQDTLETQSLDDRAAAGTVIGPYRLLQLIGEGGMGEVWLAEQKYPVRRRVAIKLIKAGMDTREVVRRFESERQALALMDHPAIAKVFDAGSTPEGRPYFVMEYVPGMPITAYCDKHRLTMRQRMELFILVCEGVQHAHQKAIIHRDLKPSNILVSEIDGKPMPRIIDFGVAKATSQLNAGTMYTRVGAAIGTLGYMSPEQADLGGEDIDTRSDVYSLGVVLYELLVGALPLDFNKLAYDEVLRHLREDDAPRPSTRLRTQGGDSDVTARNRGVGVPALVRQLRGDPDAIALKALEKDRQRRYNTPSELAADIGRYLRNDAVLAHAPSVGYRARKYVRRHRLGVAVAAAGVLLLVGFAIVQAVELRRITRERDRADRIAQFMTGMFKVPDPSNTRGNTVTAREILDKASKEIDPGLSHDPELQAQMMDTMAGTYEGLGLYSREQSLLERALEIQRRVLGPRSPATLRTDSLLANSLVLQGRYPAAEKRAREVLDIQRKTLGPKNLDTLASMNVLAIALTGQGRQPEAEKLLREVVDSRSQILGPENPQTLAATTDLAAVISEQGRMNESRLPEAEKLEREVFNIQRRVLGSDNPETLSTMLYLGVILSNERHFTEAEALQRDAIDIERRVLGPEHADTLASTQELVRTLLMDNRYPEAEKLQRATLETSRRVTGPEHPHTLFEMAQLGSILGSEGHYAEAEKLDREALEALRRTLGSEYPETIWTLGLLGSVLTRQGRYDEAKKLFNDAIQATGGKKKDAGAVASEWYNLACLAAIAGHRDEALGYLRQSIDHGLWNPNEMAGDEDLKSLHSDPRFDALVARARQAVAAKQQ